ncbi:phosphotransferase family protein [Ferroacidibacillus organovorans]|uniref:Aminoglycoside phosphotransferase domain-containing protein n=1 Tax=Ferroacidibacillus organovorans TaxID=1765683 RepID=A0A1V4ER42_9BACL|nr:phosphotransferase [Ferroacidibacillus organovorans]OPG15405.1 hypothetical protein B2M26_12005 [Ferroacidibacillus organovorans]
MNRNPTDIGQYEALLGAYFPELPLDGISLLGEGWDSIAIEVNHAFVFRIPKRPAVGRQMCKEIRVLETIRPYVKARIPLPELIGAAHGDSPVTAVGYRKLLGTPLSEIPPEDAIPLLRCPVRPVVIEVIEDFLARPQNFQFEPILLHGDLAAEHTLVNTETGEIGVIDFGDCGMGDPAYDVWPELTPFYHGPMDELFCARQGFYRKLAPFHGVLHGLLIRDDVLVTNALRQVEAEYAGKSE